MRTHNRVIQLARKAHATYWRTCDDVGAGDKLASAITSTWQSSVQLAFPGRFEAEHKIADYLGERIDLVDMKTGIAYELKVSPNNDHHEFYRDIFKVLLDREHNLPELKSFCFVCPAKAANRYKSGLRKAVLEGSSWLRLVIKVEAL